MRRKVPTELNIILLNETITKSFKFQAKRFCFYTYSTTKLYLTSINGMEYQNIGNN